MSSVARCISDIRSALNDVAQRIIKTVPRRGYRFAVPVNRRPGGQQRPEQTQTLPHAAFHPIEPRIEGPSVAVLPFANLSADPSQEYLSDGLTEDIINGLSYFSGLSVIARNSSFSFKGRAIDVRDLGTQLGVRYIVEGSVRRHDDRIRITAQLVDSQTRMQRWAERFDRSLGDVFAVQDEITQSIVRIVVAHLGSAESERVAGKPISSWTAYDLMMQGDQSQRELEQSWTPSLLYKTRSLYGEAFKVSPGNAQNLREARSHPYTGAFRPGGRRLRKPRPVTARL